MPDLNFTLAGAILPAIGYVDANGNQQTLNFRLPPRQVEPIAPVPFGHDTVASDGTMWTVNQYVEAYVEFTTTVLDGDDLDAWLDFLEVGVNGQVLTFYPNQNDNTVAIGCRLMTMGRVNSSGAPAVDPRPKWVGPSRYEVQCVLRLENSTNARQLYDALRGRLEAEETA